MERTDELAKVHRVMDWWVINMREPMTMGQRSGAEVQVLKWLRAGYGFEDLRAVWASQGGLVWRAKIMELLAEDAPGKFSLFAGMLDRCRPRKSASQPTSPPLTKEERDRVSKLLAETKARIAAGIPIDDTNENHP